MKLVTNICGDDSWEALNIRDGLSTMGWEVINRSLTDEAINELSTMEDKPILWLLISAGPHQGCSAEDVELWKEYMSRLRENGVISLYYSAGAGCGFMQMDSLGAPYVDYAITTDRASVEYFKKVGTPNVIYACFAANPRVYKKMELSYLYDVSFVGTAFGHRCSVTIPNLLDNGIKIRVWGDFWRDEERPGYISDPRVDGIAGSKVSIPYMVKIFNQTKINLCFSVGFHIDEFRGYEPRTMKLRHFEITASGGFMLTDWNHDYELDEFFVPGKECEVYDTEEELVDKIRYYLKHDGEREKIAQAGYERCINEHTWENRFKYIFNEMGILLR